MDSAQIPVHSHFNGLFKDEGGIVKYVGGCCRLSFIGQDDTIHSLRAMFCKYMNTRPDTSKFDIKLCYSGDLNKLIDIVDDDDVRNLMRIYKSHAYLLELYAVSILQERTIPTCAPDDIDEVLTDEHLDLLISNRGQDAPTSTPHRPNIETIGSSSYPILIDDQDAAVNDGGFINIDLKEETDSDVSIRIVTSAPDVLQQTYSAMDVTPLQSCDALDLTADQFDDDELVDDLIVNIATIEADGNVADMDDVQEGQRYNTQADFKRALRAYAMKRGFEYAPTKCNDRKITARCRVADCSWRIKARIVPGLTQWWVKKLESKHTCSRALGGLGHRNCDAAFISSFVREQVIANDKYTPKMIQTEILRQHGVKISYWKAYRAKERIFQEIRGDFEGSFAALPSYMRELKSRDADACLQLKYQDEGRFHRFFWAFGAAIRAFRNHCRPLLGLDGMFLHKYPIFTLLYDLLTPLLVKRMRNYIFSRIRVNNLHDYAVI